jgi:hypothetical protein
MPPPSTTVLVPSQYLTVLSSGLACETAGKIKATAILADANFTNIDIAMNYFPYI